MPVERSAGAVVFRRSGRGSSYLLLLYGKGHWDFPKGHIEKGERTEETIRREIREETGIRRIRFIPNFKETIRYGFSHQQRKILKFVVFLLAQTSQKKISLSREHTHYLWLAYEEALSQITFATSRNVLQKAHTFLNSTGR